jgi:D-alanyl-D-alanine dipeptidase
MHAKIAACASPILALALGSCAIKEKTSSAHPFPLEEITEYPGLRTDLRYKQADNITGKKLYHKNLRAYALPEVKRAIDRVVEKIRPQGYGLTILDAWRPPVPAAYLWNEAVRLGLRDFFAPPDISMHTRGAAVDLTLHRLEDPEKELAMPSPFDHTEPVLSVDPEARKNAQILERAMRAENFSGHPKEWWHYEYATAKHKPIVQNPLEGGGKVYENGIVFVPSK